MYHPSFLLVWTHLATVYAQSRTSPLSGSVIVQTTPSSPTTFTSIQAALNSLPNDTSSRSVFIYPGTYFEQVSVTRPGMTTVSAAHFQDISDFISVKKILGYTEDSSDFKANAVTIAFNLSSAQTASNNDKTATLRIHKDDFAIYNVNLRNTFGQGHQALASSAYGNNQAYYGVGFYGYQDTLYAFNGTQFYSSCYIEGAVDFIFGQHARVFFHQNTIASLAPGAITALGPFAAQDVDIFVINESNLITSSIAATNTSLTGQVFLGRPWTQWARVVYTNTFMDDLINSAGWEQWSSSTPNTDGVFFAEYNSSGPGSVGPRAPFATLLSNDTGYTIADVLGDSWMDWVDGVYY